MWWEIMRVIIRVELWQGMPKLRARMIYRLQRMSDLNLAKEINTLFFVNSA